MFSVTIIESIKFSCTLTAVALISLLVQNRKKKKTQLFSCDTSRLSPLRISIMFRVLSGILTVVDSEFSGF
jgi:hypothetical protein